MAILIKNSDNESFDALFKSFISQANTTSQETKVYKQQRIKNFHIDAGFGKGRPSRVPWLGFFADGQKPQCGIYPVCLYYKQHDLLIVAYGISQTNPPLITWGDVVSTKNTVESYIKSNAMGSAYKDSSGTMYGQSYVKEVFEKITKSIQSELSIAKSVCNCIDEMFCEYAAVLQNNTSTKDSNKTIDIETKQNPLVNEHAVSKAVPEADKATPYSLQSIRDEGCFLSLASLESMFSRLCAKKNIILQGPPGTGKTWLARRLAWALVGEKNSPRVQALQFHATLSYEDFVCGWRPVGDGKLALLDGPFLEALARANEAPEIPYVLVIEEINRGNPAQIFGELLTLLEADKRIPEEALRLCYKSSSEAPVHLPANLHLIGTMNIADRSLAIVDFALRRRFSFFDLTPNFGEDWQNWMRDRADLHTAFVAALGEAMQTCNSAIAGDPSLGPQYAIGHSFVTYDRPIPDGRAWIEEIVAVEITPLLKEYWFDDPKQAEETAQKILDALP